MKLHDAVVEKNFCSLFDMSEIFSDHYFRKIFNFRFYGERSDFDFCPIFENWQKSVWGVGISPPSDLYSYQEYKIYACYPLRTVVFYPDDFSPIYSIFIKFKKTEMTTICQKTEQSGFSSDSRLKKKKPSDKKPHRYICPRRTISLLYRRTK